MCLEVIIIICLEWFILWGAIGAIASWLDNDRKYINSNDVLCSILGGGLILLELCTLYIVLI